MDAALAFVRAREHPLAVYVFTDDAAFEKKVIGATKSGAAVVNETVISAGGACLSFLCVRRGLRWGKRAH